MKPFFLPIIIVVFSPWAVSENVSLEKVPLPWYVPTGAVPDTKPAEEFLRTNAQSPAGTLLVAAMLAVNPDHTKRQQGLRRLQSLAATLDEPNAEKEIGLLAAALLWRQQIPKLKNADDLVPLRRTLDKIPEKLQPGPLFLFGQAARQVGEHEEAVLAFMRIVILYPENRSLTDAAAEYAAKSLEKLGRADQAGRLQRSTK